MNHGLGNEQAHRRAYVLAVERCAFRQTPTGQIVFLIEGQGNDDTALKKIRARRRRRRGYGTINRPKGAA